MVPDDATAAVPLVQTEVTHETTTSKLEAAKRHKVSQAYCSALSCGYSNGSLQSWEPMATIVQDGTYEATLLAAALEQHTGQGSGRVLLTSIGGGACPLPPETSFPGPCRPRLCTSAGTSSGRGVACHAPATARATPRRWCQRPS